MLMAERPNIVYAAGENYSRKGHRAKNGLDVSDPLDCLKFDVEEDMNYFAWWYLAIPVSYVKKIGYPLPLFIKWDDIEYGIRGSSTMITLNGVSVWHHSIRGRLLISNQYSYYISRNCLAIGCTTGDMDVQNAAWVLRSAMFEVISHRYENAEMMFRGIEDFLKGSEFVFDLTPDNMMKAVPVATGKLKDLEQKGNFINAGDIKKTDFKIRMLSLNGLLLPAKRNIITAADNTDSACFYRVGKVLYDLGNGDGAIAERNFKKAVLSMFRAFCLLERIVFSFRRLKKEYRRSLKKYSSEENWRRIFGL
jgi:hypothetical protein